MPRTGFFEKAAQRRVAIPTSGTRCILASVFLLVGAAWRDTPLSTLNPAGPSAESIALLWWVMFWGATAITFFMIVLGAYAVYRNPERRRKVPARLFIVGGGVIFPLSVVTALLVYGLVRAPALWSSAIPDNAFEVQVIGHQWWWEVRYPNIDGRTLYEANEIHIPVNRPVVVHVASADVIHSFWVPRLAGKIDAIPGIVNRMQIETSRAGVYRGSCAEFCGTQHARMGFLVEAHEDDALTARLASLAAAREPRAAPAAFEEHCAVCHSRDSRTASESRGPNLANLHLRKTLGAGTIRNEPGAIYRWLNEHLELKPGNRMPAFDHLPP